MCIWNIVSYIIIMGGGGGEWVGGDTAIIMNSNLQTLIEEDRLNNL